MMQSGGLGGDVCSAEIKRFTGSSFATTRALRWLAGGEELIRDVINQFLPFHSSQVRPFAIKIQDACKFIVMAKALDSKQYRSFSGFSKSKDASII